MASTISIHSNPMSLEENNMSPIRKICNLEQPAKYSGKMGDLRSIQEINPKYRQIFEYPFFNKIQSIVFDDALYSDKSIVVSAPTGSGKTIILELAIVQLLMTLEKLRYEGDFKIVYLAPVKALCTERLTDWYKKFSRLGIPCIEVTGDSNNLDFCQLQSYRIIMTTPEKWDSLTRRWKDNKLIVQVVKLFIIDEVHLLNEDVRGPVLEAVVSRMKTIQASIPKKHNMQMNIQQEYKIIEHSNNQGLNQNDNENSFNKLDIDIRFIALSATIPNAEDIAEWLGTKEKPAACYKIGEEMRPVKLVKIVEGYPYKGQGLFKFDLWLSYKLRGIIEKYCNGKPTLIFCNTRKSVMMAAEILSKELLFQFSEEQRLKFSQTASQLSEKKLQVLAIGGIGCHHAGFIQKDRNIIEEMFRCGDLPILITTSTLAMGVNLPAHLVIIKTTQHYINGAYKDYDESTILQMMGRAGRPQFDTEGVAVIMTSLQDKARYAQLCGGQRSVESALARQLAEHLNAEAALGGLPDLLAAMDWMRSTFLYVRAVRQPNHYGYRGLARPGIEKKLEELCLKWMNALARGGMISMDADARVTPTQAGVLMASYCLDFHTMQLIIKIQGNESLKDLVTLISKCHEFSEIALRTSEKRCLNLLNRNSKGSATCRFPQPGKIQDRHMKANCLIQATFGSLPILDPSLNQEATKILRTGERISKCTLSYVTRDSLIESGQPIFQSVLNATVLAKCFAAQLWENSPYVVRQLSGIGQAFASALVSAGKTCFKNMMESNPRDLERIMNKLPPAGNLLKKQVSLLPVYELTLNMEPGRIISLTFSIKNYNDLLKHGRTTEDRHKVTLLAGDSNNNLLYMEKILDSTLLKVSNAQIIRKFATKCPEAHSVFAHCISNSWVGLDNESSIQVKKSLSSLISGPLRRDISNYLGKHSQTNTVNQPANSTGEEVMLLSQEKKKISKSPKCKENSNNSLKQREGGSFMNQINMLMKSMTPARAHYSPINTHLPNNQKYIPMDASEHNATIKDLQNPPCMDTNEEKRTHYDSESYANSTQSQLKPNTENCRHIADCEHEMNQNEPDEYDENFYEDIINKYKTISLSLEYNIGNGKTNVTQENSSIISNQINQDNIKKRPYSNSIMSLEQKLENIDDVKYGSDPKVTKIESRIDSNQNAFLEMNRSEESFQKDVLIDLKDDCDEFQPLEKNDCIINYIVADRQKTTGMQNHLGAQIICDLESNHNSYLFQDNDLYIPDSKNVQNKANNSFFDIDEILSLDVTNNDLYIDTIDTPTYSVHLPVSEECLVSEEIINKNEKNYTIKKYNTEKKLSPFKIKKELKRLNSQFKPSYKISFNPIFNNIQISTQGINTHTIIFHNIPWPLFPAFPVKKQCAIKKYRRVSWSRPLVQVINKKNKVGSKIQTYDSLIETSAIAKQHHCTGQQLQQNILNISLFTAGAVPYTDHHLPTQINITNITQNFDHYLTTNKIKLNYNNISELNCENKVQDKEIFFSLEKPSLIKGALIENVVEMQFKKVDNAATDISDDNTVGILKSNSEKNAFSLQSSCQNAIKETQEKNPTNNFNETAAYLNVIRWIQISPFECIPELEVTENEDKMSLNIPEDSMGYDIVEEMKKKKQAHTSEVSAILLKHAAISQIKKSYSDVNDNTGINIIQEGDSWEKDFEEFSINLLDKTEKSKQIKTANSITREFRKSISDIFTFENDDILNMYRDNESRPEYSHALDQTLQKNQGNTLQNTLSKNEDSSSTESNLSEYSDLINKLKKVSTNREESTSYENKFNGLTHENILNPQAFLVSAYSFKKNETIDSSKFTPQYDSNFTNSSRNESKFQFRGNDNSPYTSDTVNIAQDFFSSETPQKNNEHNCNLTQSINIETTVNPSNTYAYKVSMANNRNPQYRMYQSSTAPSASREGNCVESSNMKTPLEDYLKQFEHTPNHSKLLPGRLRYKNNNSRKLRKY